MNDKKHTHKVIIGKNREKEIELKDVNYGNHETRWFVGDTEFDGHHTLWGFSYEPENYLKESELSGDEYRKGGSIKIFRNNVQVFEQFCRETDYALFKTAEILHDLQALDFEKIKEGQKIYWKNVPATIGYVMMEQGTMMVKAEEGRHFPDNVWAKEEWEKLEDKNEVKTEFTDKNIWWWRD